MNLDGDEHSDYSDLEDNYSDFVPEYIRSKAEDISLNNLPDKSKKDYVARYNHFKKWRKENVKSNSFDEDIVLVYFDFLSQTYAPPSLWVYFSQLKGTFAAFHHLDISSYKRVILFLKKKMCRYVVKKSAVFSKDNIITFLSKAPDVIHLATKVSLIFGIAGALRRKEFTTMKVGDLSLIEDDALHVRVPTTKTGRPRSFTIEGVLLDVVKNYIAARPEDCGTDRFFLNYQNGKCTKQPIGINKFGSMPRVIANVLEIPNATEFTGHSFRRTSATLLADAGADMTTLKRHGDWKSNSVVEGYIAESIQNKRKIYNQITEGIILNKKVKPDNNATEKLPSHSGNHPKIISSHCMEGSSKIISHKVGNNRILLYHNFNILKSDEVVIKKKEIPTYLKKTSVFNFPKCSNECSRTTKSASNLSTNVTVQYDKNKIQSFSSASAEPSSQVHQSLLSDTMFEDEEIDLFEVDENFNKLKTKPNNFEQTSNSDSTKFFHCPRARTTSLFSDSVANVTCDSNQNDLKESFSSFSTRVQSESLSSQNLSSICDQLEHLTDVSKPVLYHPDKGLYVEEQKNMTFLNCTFNIQMVQPKEKN